MKIEDLHKVMENQRLEFKTAFGKETIETVAAFSNAEGGTVYKLLAEAFYLRGDIEKFGTGFYRIQMELKNFPDLQFAVEPLNGFMRSGLKVSSKDTMQVTAHDTAHVTAHDSAQVKELILHLSEEMSRSEIQLKLNISHREYFRLQYLQQALTAGVIELTLPEKPKSKLQKYRLTEKGKKIREQLIEEKTGKNEK